jgi:diguanylate cyclase (GGDEF)-like protein
MPVTDCGYTHGSDYNGRNGGVEQFRKILRIFCISEVQDLWGLLAAKLMRTSKANSEPKSVEELAWGALLGALGHCIVDPGGLILACDSIASAWLGLEPAAGEIPLQKTIAAENLSLALSKVVEGGGPTEVDGRLLTGADASIEAHVAVRFDLLTGPATPSILVTIRRVEPAAPCTTFDALTQLPDRRAIADRVDAWRRAAAPAEPRFAVLFLDLDDFKRVNDGHGHAMGDQLLQSLAERWLDCVRDGDLVARYGGDEFVILLANADSADEVEPVVRRLMEATCRPLVIGGQALQVAATIGWVAAEGDDWTIESLIAAADRRMYDQKPVARRSARGSQTP